MDFFFFLDLQLLFFYYIAFGLRLSDLGFEGFFLF